MLSVGLAWIIISILLYDVSLKVNDRYIIVRPIVVAIRFRKKNKCIRILGLKYRHNVAYFTSIFLSFIVFSQHFLIIDNSFLPKGIKYGYFIDFYRINKYRISFIALKWIHENINAHDLILNDMTWISYWLESLSYKNLVFMRCLINRPKEEYLELANVWFHPHNKSLVIKVLKNII